ncbi:MAG: (Fe-S)-binding protein, partial [Ruminococcus sp.]|nr:(Fe-S)-binding protein [Ruminococcus sp.]
ASTDILAVDQACIDLVYAMREDENHALVERIETRHGHRQLSCMKEMGMGNDRYILIDVDRDDQPITRAQAVENLEPFKL